MDCIELLRELIGFDTVNPPGNEKPAAQYLAGILKPLGFRCEVQAVSLPCVKPPWTAPPGKNP